jgi:hypothetical protein
METAGATVSNAMNKYERFLEENDAEMDDEFERVFNGKQDSSDLLMLSKKNALAHSAQAASIKLNFNPIKNIIGDTK